MLKSLKVLLILNILFVKNFLKNYGNLLKSESYVNTLGSLSGNQAVQHAKAGLKSNLFKWMASSSRR